MYGGKRKRRSKKSERCSLTLSSTWRRRRSLKEFREETAENFRALRAEVADVRRDVEELKSRVDNSAGYSKEIDHALERIAAIEKHLGSRRSRARGRLRDCRADKGSVLSAVSAVCGIERVPEPDEVHGMQLAIPPDREVRV